MSNAPPTMQNFAGFFPRGVLTIWLQPYRLRSKFLTLSCRGPTFLDFFWHPKIWIRTKNLENFDMRVGPGKSSRWPKFRFRPGKSGFPGGQNFWIGPRKSGFFPDQKNDQTQTHGSRWESLTFDLWKVWHDAHCIMTVEGGEHCDRSYKMWIESYKRIKNESKERHKFYNEEEFRFFYSR